MVRIYNPSKHLTCTKLMAHMNVLALLWVVMVFESFAIHFLWGSHLNTSLWYNYVDKFVVKPTILFALCHHQLIQLTVLLFYLYKTYTTNAFVQLRYLFAIMAHQSKLPSLAQTHAWHTCIAIYSTIHPWLALHRPWYWKHSFLLATHIIDTTKMPTKHNTLYVTQQV